MFGLQLGVTAGSVRIMSNAVPIIAGAEPVSHAGSSLGALVLHGFTGNPGSMRIIADAFVAEGWSVEMPRLPGHGTTIEDMMETSFDDWSAEAERAYQKLADSCERVVVIGLSMGGSLTLWLGTRHAEIAGLVAINPAAVIGPDMATMVQDMLAAGEKVMPGIGSDIAKEGVVETAYADTPLLQLKSLMEASQRIEPQLPRITSPLLLLTSENDHVVPPTDSDHVASVVSGPVEREIYPLSYHVITMDHEAEAVVARTLEFAKARTS